MNDQTGRGNQEKGEDKSTHESDKNRREGGQGGNQGNQ